MFDRYLTELCDVIMSAGRADAVEVCQQVLWVRPLKETGEPAAMFSRMRVRAREATGERQLTTDAWLPDPGMLVEVLSLMAPCPPEAPIAAPSSAPERNSPAAFELPPRHDANVAVHVREWIVTSRGVRQMADVRVPMVRTGRGWRRPMAEWVDHGGSRRRVLLDPLMVPDLIAAGWLTGHVAVTPPVPFFHDRFDGIGQTDGWWVRLPVALTLADRALTVSGLPAGKPDGTMAVQCRVAPDAVEIEDRDGRVARLHRSVLQSIQQISTVTSVTDGHMPYRLPVVALEGDWEWA